jgi:hypothetical protein
MVGPVNPSSNPWANFDQGIHESANLIVTLRNDANTMNTTTDYDTFLSLEQKINAIISGTDSSFSLLSNSPLAKKMISGLQAPLNAALANFNVSVNGTVIGTAAATPNPLQIQTQSDYYHGPSTDDLMSYMPSWAQNDSTLRGKIEDAKNYVHDHTNPGSPGRTTVTYTAPNGLTITVDLSSHMDPPHENKVYIDVYLSGSIKNFQKQGYSIAVSKAGNGSQPFTDYINQFS